MTTPVFSSFYSDGITALLPVKNGSKYIENISKTISNNMRSHDEIIAIDDNSEDDTYRQLLKWAKLDSRVRVIKNPNSGLVSTLNLGIKESSNSWIARFDVDDDYPFNRIEKQVSSISPSVVAVFSDYEIMTAKHKSLGVIPSPVNPLAVAVSLLKSRRTAHPSAVINKVAVESVGSYRESDFPAEDLSLWLRLSRVGNLISTPEILLFYKIHKNSVSQINTKKISRLRMSIIDSISLDRKLLSIALDSVSKISEEYNHYKYSSERKVLFLQESATALHLSDYSKSKFIASILKSQISLKDTSSISGILRQTLHRKFYRKIL
jgi:glycosyltransferase involved in cell wall biosynthesis